MNFNNLWHFVSMICTQINVFYLYTFLYTTFESTIVWNVVHCCWWWTSPLVNLRSPYPDTEVVPPPPLRLQRHHDFAVAHSSLHQGNQPLLALLHLVGHQDVVDLVTACIAFQGKLENAFSLDEWNCRFLVIGLY